MLYLLKVTEACNFECKYCYYRCSGRTHSANEMAPDELEGVLSWILGREREPRFAFHGGEPLLYGIRQFRRILEHVRTTCEASDNDAVISLQTNGSLVDEAWCDLFEEFHVGVGVSYDGDLEAHCALRSPKLGHLTLRGLSLLMERDIPLSVLAVISRRTVSMPEEVFRNIYDTGVRTWDYLPCVEKMPGHNSECISAEEYAHFLDGSFNAWVDTDDPDVRVRTIEETIHGLMGRAPTLCRMRNGCACLVTLNPDGTVYGCDRYCGNPELAIGRFSIDGIEYALERSDIRPTPLQCSACEWVRICEGGCAFSRSNSSDGMDPLCTGYKGIFGKARDFLEGSGLLSGAHE